MNKRVIKPIITAVSLIALVAFSCFGLLYLVRDQDPEPYPDLFRDYPEGKGGFYQFDPQTILASLDRGETDVFRLLDDPGSANAEYAGIDWTQTEFLRVANALSRQVWNEPLEFDQWNVYSVLFSGGSCRDNISGFIDFDITYYKTIKTGWEMAYTARNIKLFPREGKAVWSGNGDFSANFFQRWQNIELTKFQITAEQAYRIAEENGGRAARRNSDNKYCQIFVSAENGQDSWLVDYTAKVFKASIDPFTGKVH